MVAMSRFRRWRDKHLNIENHVKFQSQQTVTVRSYTWNDSKSELISSQGNCVPNIIDPTQMVHVERTGEKILTLKTM